MKNTVYDLTRQFYREGGIEYTNDYYDYLVDYDRWSDWLFKVQKAKNLKESKLINTLQKKLNKIITRKRII